MHKRMAAWKRPRLFVCLVVLLSALGVYETVLQIQDARYVRSVAQEIVQKAGATTPRERIVALRLYLLAHIRYQDAPYLHRPFLRASASDILRSGKGYCGEVTRILVCMANEVGLHAQRINLSGTWQHVVAEVELSPSEQVIVDAQYPPLVPDLVPLDKVMLQPQFTTYSSVNLHRLHLDSIISQVKWKMGPLPYWLENPHLLAACMWYFLALALLTFQGARKGMAYLLHKRGWVRVAEVEAEVESPRELARQRAAHAVETLD